MRCLGAICWRLQFLRENLFAAHCGIVWFHGTLALEVNGALDARLGCVKNKVDLTRASFRGVLAILFRARCIGRVFLGTLPLVGLHPLGLGMRHNRLYRLNQARLVALVARASFRCVLAVLFRDRCIGRVFPWNAPAGWRALRPCFRPSLSPRLQHGSFLLLLSKLLGGLSNCSLLLAGPAFCSGSLRIR